MRHGVNLLIEPPAVTAHDPSVHRFELEVQCAAPGHTWRATLRLSGGRYPLVFDSPAELSRALAQLTLHSAGSTKPYAAC